MANFFAGLTRRLTGSKIRSRNKASHSAAAALAAPAAPDAAQTQSLAQRLGYDRDARLLIVHADDLGLAPGVNTAFIDGAATGRINSGSAMVPCMAFPEIAAFARSHPEADIGLHLTLTSARTAPRWAPVAPAEQVPSLIDRDGYFHQAWSSETPIVPAQVEIELRAQIDNSYAAGLRPTHIDSHQFLLQRRNAKLFEIYVKLSREYNLPMLISREWFTANSYFQSLLGPEDIVLDRIVTITPKTAPEQWSGFYRREIETLPPGVSELLIHPAHDGDALRNFFQNRSEWGAAWRQRDFDFFTSDDFADILEKENIKLMTWREITARLQ
ncbi:MAG TPA: polysaccharide deacetylase family protein [Rhizomicrobium sp.]|nr:polysaccharide deacetylase family protein [Rhizomicrobium sp.]